MLLHDPLTHGDSLHVVVCWKRGRSRIVNYFFPFLHILLSKYIFTLEYNTKQITRQKGAGNKFIDLVTACSHHTNIKYPNQHDNTTYISFLVYDSFNEIFKKCKRRRKEGERVRCSRRNLLVGGLSIKIYTVSSLTCFQSCFTIKTTCNTLNQGGRLLKEKKPTHFPSLTASFQYYLVMLLLRPIS